MHAVVSALNVYPVKSCRGIALSAVRLAETGLLHDREWMIVDAASRPWRFVTQRDRPRLALIETTLVGDGALRLRGDDGAVIDIRFDRAGDTRDVTVWRDTLAAIDQGDAVAEWLSARVGANVRLVRFDRTVRRFCNREYAGDSGAHHQFADGYPLLVATRASLDDLNARLLERGVDALPMNRFRPNIVLDGVEAYDEDHIATITIGDARLRLVKPCTRCQITTTDQQTAEVGGIEPLATLARYRLDAKLDGVTFGVNAIVERGAGSMLAVGAKAEIGWRFD